MGKVALFYGTRFGGTTGIAQKIAEILASKDHDVVLKNIEDLAKFSEIEANMFDGIILGSGIQIGQWTGKMKAFITKHKTLLSNNERKLGLFVSCGTAHSEEGKTKACKDYITNLSTEFGLAPHIIAAFGGIYDFRKKSSHGLVKKKLLQAITKKETPGKFIMDDINDFRNWDDISSFATKFAALL
ncbi:MAG: flavodoxin domain-containing protein [Promethearchaeota archaeon]